MNWFKFYGQDWLTDIKVMRLSIEDRLCFITLLCLASTSDEYGVIKNCDEEAIVRLTHLYPANKARGFLKRLDDNKMITNDNAGNIIINNFLKRQSKNLSGYERIKKYREKLKDKKPHNKAIKNDNDDNTNDNVDDNAMITLDKIREDKRRIDKIREDKNINIESGDKSPTPAQIARDFFDNQEKQEEIIQDLIAKSAPEEIVRREINKFCSYWTEKNKSGTKQRWETEKTFEIKRRLATWFGNIKNFSRSQNNQQREILSTT